MTQRRELERHRRSLWEIHDIMNSMKTLAYMETRKVARFLDAQQAVVASIGNLAADFLSFYPEALPETDEAPRVYLLIGSERGFCGDLNHTLLTQLRAAREQFPFDQTNLIGIGRKLNMLLEDDETVAALIDGASVVEEVPAVLNQLVRELSSLQEIHGIVSVYGIYHGSLDGIVMQKLLPPFQHYLHQPRRFAHPPELNMSPADFLLELTEQHLFAALHEMLYTSLMTENRSRMSHLEGAVQHLDDESDELARKCNALRQEEIIEEIEVILLSASSIDERGHTPATPSPCANVRPRVTACS